MPVSKRSGPKEQNLVSQGWAKQFCTSGSRVQEAAELYESMGFEVHLEPVRAEDLGCSECLQGPVGSLGDCYVIYTRPKDNAEDKKLPGAKKTEDEPW